ncbi:hypothetical protein [Ralstonia solanacearum]|uniref:Transmembrane protein n=1 Tax=Ralstonia solanacearum TaxID=305 RepID=A0AAE3T366_RALSL|nr:hypothetical protein [Ralstonia solanacearum]MBB6583829.1 hypothetical protein [Ralstonia solanacearum]MDB0521739.1 hypothetical protein [Ralstonia solanacearum]
MSTPPIVDADALIKDLRIAVTYAVRAGLLRDKEIIDLLETAEVGMKNGAGPDFSALTLSLNGISRVIAPITLADLHCNRDPFEEGNQKHSRVLQLFLTILALVVLLAVGTFMDALRIEQEALTSLTQIRDLRPDVKLNAVRKMAQDKSLLQAKEVFYEEYQRKVGELRQLNSKIEEATRAALAAYAIPLIPLPTTLLAQYFVDQGAEIPASAAPEQAANVHAGRSMTAAADVTAPASGTPPNAEAEQRVILCVADSDGRFVLPQDKLMAPAWMREIMADAYMDMCFQINVLSNRSGALAIQEISEQLNYIPRLRDKVTLRATWFLPFLYGLLGAILCVMRNVASVRTPAIEWLPMIMRISLGGVAGIVMGWFSSNVNAGLESTSVLSVPFALAFLTGYGIDVLFSLLDRLNSAIAQPGKTSST